MKLAENLKKAVLQAAMQGKLTHQLKTDSSVDDLLQKIAEEKARLIAEGKIKKERGESLPLAPERKHSSATPSPRGTPPKTPDNSPQVLEENSESSHQQTTSTRFEPIPQEEIPFEIPENWRWERLQNISTYGQPKKKKSASELTDSDWVLDLEDIERDTGRILNKASIKTRQISGEKVVFDKNDILYSKLRPYLKKNLVAPECGVCTSEIVPFKTFGNIYNEFINQYLKSPFVDSYINSVTYGMKMPRVGTDTMLNLPIPLPPIEEQQRIVEKLNSILPLIDEYGKEEDELVALSQNFPEEIKKSVLQAAMQGKLTQQLQTDSSVDELLKKIAEEKETLIKEGKIKKDTTKAGASGRALAEITQEEIPFEIPENWRWVRWGNLSNSIQYGYNASAISSGFAKMVRISDIQDNQILWDTVPYCEITESEYEKYKLNNTDLLFARTGGTVGKSVLVSGLTERSVYAGYLIRSHYNQNLNPQYLKYFMECPLYWSQLTQGTTKGCQPNCNGQTLSQMILPLPPIEEQQRIVEKLNSILPLIDSMAVYGTKKKAGRPKQEEALSFIRTFLQAQKPAQPKTAAPEILELKTKAKQELPAAVQKYAGLMGVTYNRITIRHQKTRWGSCTKTGNLNFNCLIMKIPDQVRDYVIIHELAHRKELNHSSKYWAIVAEYCPWYKQAKQWLKDNGQGLMER